MRKHLLVTLLLTCGLPFSGQMYALANPEPQSQSQAAVTIKGTVLDENNEPAIGASVTAKGNSKGVSTDGFGNFTIKVVPGTNLTVTYVGYKQVTVKAADGMSVYLQPTTEVLDQLVVVGYGQQKRANLTGAVATVDVARTMDGRPQTDVAKALQGSVPGLTITSSNGDITSAGNATMRIRGAGTLSNGQTSNPLIVANPLVTSSSVTLCTMSPGSRIICVSFSLGFHLKITDVGPISSSSKGKKTFSVSVKKDTDTHSEWIPVHFESTDPTDLTLTEYLVCP